MKIQCNACEAAEANVLCCADEAALCWACDQEVHAANKLAGKHQRVPLTGASSSQVPKCDICQEASGYFFCLEDRALLCRKCDISIHSVNSYVSAHQRFLLTGVRVESEPSKPDLPFSSERPSLIPQAKSLTERSLSVSLSGDNNEAFCQLSRNGSLPASKTVLADGTVNMSMFDWPFDDIFGMEFNQNYGFPGHETSKADSGKLGSSEGSQFHRPADAEHELECESQVPDITQWTVPEIPSPPTASGLHWPRNLQRSADRSVFVPDVCASSFHLDSPRYHQSPTKRRRHR